MNGDVGKQSQISKDYKYDTSRIVSKIQLKASFLTGLLLHLCSTSMHYDMYTKRMLTKRYIDLSLQATQEYVKKFIN